MVEWDAEHLKSYFEMRFQEAEKAIRLRNDELEYRLRDLKDIQNSVLRDLGLYLKTEVYDKRHEELRMKLEKYDTLLSRMEGAEKGGMATKTWIIAALGLVMAVLAALIALHNYIVR